MIIKEKWEFGGRNNSGNSISDPLVFLFNSHQKRFGIQLVSIVAYVAEMTLFPTVKYQELNTTVFYCFKIL